MTWTIDLQAATATHASGLVIKFAPAHDTRGAFDGQAIGPVPAALKAGTMADQYTTLARLMREAGEAYIAARAARH